MLSVSCRILLATGLVAGVLSACAHSGGASPRVSEEPSPRRSAGVTSDDIEVAPSKPIEQVLMSQVPGVWITRTNDGGIAIRIRGATSVHGSNQPLYILDGFPFQPGANGSLAGINPYDIATIEVLKDAASTAMYGIRGANGVIVIKTKQAN